MESLSNIQADIKAKMHKAKTNFKKSSKDRLTITYLETRLENLDKQWALFTNTHTTILSTVNKTDLSNSDYVKTDLYDEVEEFYVQYKSELKEVILSKSKVTATIESANPKPCGELVVSRVKLPDIKIPTFSGKYSEWQTFRDLFVSLIHENKTIDDAQKIYYLKGHVTGEAEQLLRNVKIASDNYATAWNTLNKMYNNKRYLAKGIIKRLLSQKVLTSESASEIKGLVNTTSECLDSMRALGVDTSSWDILIIYIISAKLDPETRKAWELMVSSDQTDELPTYTEFSEFLIGRFRGLENLDLKPRGDKKVNTKSFHIVKAKGPNSCAFCAADHKIVSCKAFSKESNEKRREFAMDKKLCFVCLHSNHSAKQCKNITRCKACKRRHHSLLHPSGVSGSVDEETVHETASSTGSMKEEFASGSQKQAAQAEGSNEPLVSCLATGNCNKTVLLTTAVVQAESKDGTFRMVRALLDQGSQGSFITESIVQYLGLKKFAAKHTISGVGGDKSVISRSTVNLNIRSRVDPRFQIMVNAYVLKSITSLLPVTKVTRVERVQLTVGELADPEYHRPNKIDVLLGAEIYSHIIKAGINRDSSGSILVQDTAFGWILSGACEVDNRANVSSHITVMHSCLSADEFLKGFWELEAEPTGIKKMLTEEEIRCEELFTATTERDSHGRYIVRLPFRDADPDCKYGGSRKIAEKRLRGLEFKLGKNIKLRTDYTNVIKDYLELNHMRRVTNLEKTNKEAVYLPHHAVVREDKDTTKVRVVFDASCKGMNGISLNDNLMIGPSLQAELRHTIMCWRKYKICLVGDIIKMYRQVLVHKEDTPFQRILWRESPERDIEEFELVTVTFGTAAAPYLAVRALQQVANDECQDSPEIAKIIRNDFYMDDLMTGAENVDNGYKIYRELTRVLAKGGFQMQKWISNSKELLDKIKNENDSSNEVLRIKLDEITKILGLTWYPRKDVFRYTVNLAPLCEPATKRKVISDISRLFDPLGWLAPCIIGAKVFIQKLWLAGIDWDQEVPINLLTEWMTYRQDLPSLENVRIPRWLHTHQTGRLELHGFADASKLAYAAVVYLRVIDEKENIHVSLVTSKTKVAPIKQVSIPRLELCGAVLLSKLIVEVAEVLGISKANLYAYTDSEVVLAWLNQHPSRWKTFVANRVSEILTTIDTHHWSHISSKQNPADCASRGISPTELSTTSIWFDGPEFLRHKVIDFKKPKHLVTSQEQTKTHTTVLDITLWQRFSCLSKLLRVIAYCRRFLNLRKTSGKKHCTKHLIAQEMNAALEVCVKRCQEDELGEELEELRDKGSLSTKGKRLKSLNLFLDAHGVIRVEIVILDKNDSPPEFKNIPPAYPVSEDLAPGQRIANIVAEDPDTIGTITFSIQNDEITPFSLDPHTGLLTLKDPLDRETISEYQVIVRADDGIQYTDVTVVVQVTDTNDNPPVFKESAYSFDIPENAARGSVVGTVMAIDLDSGPNAQLTYTVISDWANDVFSLNPQTGVFSLTARLDYEETQHYILVAQAQDNGHPSLSGTVTVYVNVIDLNDNAPVFDPMSFSNEILEDVPVGSSVVTISATDSDSGLNGKVAYTISSGDDGQDFTIAENGTIYTAKLLDRETVPVYNIVVTAKDMAKLPEPQLSSTVQVTIQLKDVNDMAPEFVTPNITTISENIPLNTVVMTIKAVDKDEGRNGYVEYFMTPDPEINGYFSLGNVDGILRATGKLDRELKASYTITVTAKDRGDPPNVTKSKIKINILDENDNSPVFDPKQYSASVPENASIGASVLQVSATDIDEGANGRVQYSIASGDENRDFSISEDTGIVRVAKNLNFERKSRYLLTIRAEDCAKDDVRFDTAELSISIQDINDNPPTFLDSPYLAYVMENVIPPNGGYIITIHAYDADSPPFNNQVRYFIKEGDADLFKINASSGQISLLRTLDREAQDEFTLALVAMDTGSPPLTGSGTVKIVVQDVNDNSPDFERQSYKTYVKENLPLGTVILTPKATDKDVGNNAKIRYSLLGDKSERFQINSSTGIITTNATLDREDWEVYYLIIMAQDSSTTDPRTATANLTIIIEDENDNTPIFAHPVYEAHISDRTVKGDFVFGVKASDNDIGLNKKIVYDLKGEHHNLFSINRETGVIKANESLMKYKDKIGSTFNLLILATDSGKDPRQSTAELILIPKSVKNFPKFTVTNKLTFTFSEDTSEGVLVTRLSATSPKKGPTGLLQYGIAGGNVGDALRVEPMSGEVFITGKGLDYETMPLYEVWFEVRDSDNPPLKSFIEIEIKVTDANDNAPIIDNPLYNATVLEEESPPQLVIKIDAHDEDSNENGRISFKLVDDYDETFIIDTENGEISTNIALDRETIPFYELVVEAVDHGVPQLVGSSTVIVTVLDKNDNPPRFTRLFSVNVTENAEIGSFVIRVTSSDLDSGPNANATFSFVENPGNKFIIDPISGNVTVARPLDRELQDEYILKVAATDGAWRSETPLTITIQDQNDNAPEFEYSFYSFNFPELQKKNSFVGQVIATDRDKQGPNSIISYSLQQPSDLFSIDPATGEILSKFMMNYKRTSINSSPENTYSVVIVATDNGKPPMSSECLVTINVVDANNNAPKFKEHEKLVPVPKDAKPGEKIIKLTAEDDMDFGINAEVEYYIRGGNGSAYLGIDKKGGWIVVNKQFYNMGQYYELKIKAIDRGVPPQSDETAVIFVVTGENLYSPKFTALSYQVIVPENEPVGSSILTVKASDEDHGPNGIVRYSISSGNAGEEFQIDPISGAISILRPVDFDTIQEYRLNITAKDLGFKPKETIATLTIILTDINDNAPQFNQSQYVAYLPENSPVNSFIYKVTAIDIDSPKNAIIKYYINNEMASLFHIDVNSGEIFSKKVFDYEEKTVYSLEIRAENPDSVMRNTTMVIIHITGVNEYFPKFKQPVFHFDVSESAEVGTNVGIIQATDQDNGDDGIIYYLFVGSSNDKGFSINSQTGVIRVARYLDRETQNRFVLTVLAKNSGGIHGNDTDEAQVIISIQDGNDPPEFLHHYYEATISEGAVIGQEVIQVHAVDKDVRPQNNQFSFSIIGGNANQDFKIDPQTGEIEVARQLDRETLPTYSLIVGAIDTGVPPQTGTATVKISLTDINDNGPIFDISNFEGSVYENEPPNTSIATISATDPDLPPNGAPFSYTIVGGKHQGYVKVHRHTGILVTTKKVDREVTPNLEVVIQIEDSGSPVMKSNYTLSIKVLDRNDNPPTPRSAHIIVYAFNNKVPRGKIADVKPNDPDFIGEYKCKIIKDSTSENTVSLLNIRTGCNLHTNAVKPGQGYSFSVSGNDGVHRDVVSSISVEFFSFDNSTVEHSVTMRILNMTASNFLTYYYRSLLEILREDLRNKVNIYLYSINEVENHLDITIAARGNNTIWKKENTEKLLKTKEMQITKLLKTEIIVAYFPCASQKCQNDGLCTDSIRVLDDTKIIESSTLILSSPLVKHEYICHCSDGFIGTNCENRQDPCSPNPCRYGGQCRKQGHEFTCTCPARRDGKTCELERDDVCSNNPCKNGGSCKESADKNSFFCLCRPGYRGNHCEALVDSCRPNPCLHGGICISLKPGYKCSCTDGRYGTHCESTTFGFGELSYMQFPSLDASTNDITIIFATTKPEALLLYNYGAQTGGRSDFIAIELLGGKPSFSFGGARTSITSVAIMHSNKNLADGSWYKLTATRNGRVISLSIASCTDHGDICTECEPGDDSCYDDDIGQAGTLNFNNEPLLIGGLHKADPVLERPGQIHSDDFVGCMHSITVNGRMLNLTNPLRSRSVEPKCDRSEKGACFKKDVCGLGQCLDRWKANLCKCDAYFVSPDCSRSLQSISVAENGFVSYTISEKHRRMQLLETFYGGNTGWSKKNTKSSGKVIPKVNSPAKTLSFLFRTHRKDGVLFYSATDKYFTLIELLEGKVIYTSKQNTVVNMSQAEQNDVSDGTWHNITLVSIGRSIRLLVDAKNVGEELDAAGVHDFLDPYLTVISLGGIKPEWVTTSSQNKFEGCLANFSVNYEIQPFSGNGSIFQETTYRGKILNGCHSAFGIGAAQNHPLRIGITLVIVFFVILLVAISVSIIFYRLRKQKKEKSNGAVNKSGMVHSKQNGGPAMLNAPNLIAGTNDSLMNRNLHNNDTSLNSYMSENVDITRNVGHIVGPELLSKKYKDREIMNIDPPRPQRPDIIEREVVGKSPALRDDHHPPPPPSTNNSHHTHDHPSGMDLNSEVPEHYDLENASSIAPSDIDIVYHYKGFREAAGVRKYKATPPPIAGYHHKHQTPQHRHSPHHPSGYPSRVPQAAQPPPQPRQHQTTPLARLSPSSELSQQPRILTLHDISGKPLQSALLATTSSSGGVGKDALHSNSERSLNSPVMSQLSGQSSSAGRKTPSAPPQVPQVVSVGSGAVGLTAEEIERMNARQRTSSLVSTLDAVSSSSEAPRGGGVGHHMSHRHHSPPDDNRSSTGSDDESGNDSFTCSEIEYDNNSINADKLEDVRRQNVSSGSNPKKPILPPPYESFDSSFRGSLSTLVASDDDLAPHVSSALYRQANGSPASAALGWGPAPLDLFNWGPNFESMIDVFKDIAELPDSVNGRISSSLRLQNGTPKPSEEYV